MTTLQDLGIQQHEADFLLMKRLKRTTVWLASELNINRAYISQYLNHNFQADKVGKRVHTRLIREQKDKASNARS